MPGDLFLYLIANYINRAFYARFFAVNAQEVLSDPEKPGWQ